MNLLLLNFEKAGTAGFRAIPPIGPGSVIGCSLFVDIIPGKVHLTNKKW